MILASIPDAYNPPIAAPALHPDIMLILILAFSKAFRTPICAKPLAVPLPNARPIFISLFFSRFALFFVTIKFIIFILFKYFDRYK